MAIQMNRVDFVELLMDQGVGPKQFLTKSRLIALYNYVSNIKQNHESTEGCSKSIVRNSNDKFGKRTGLNK